MGLCAQVGLRSNLKAVIAIQRHGTSVCLPLYSGTAFLSEDWWHLGLENWEGHILNGGLSKDNYRKPHRTGFKSTLLKVLWLITSCQCRYQVGLCGKHLAFQQDLKRGIEHSRRGVIHSKKRGVRKELMRWAEDNVIWWQWAGPENIRNRAKRMGSNTCSSLDVVVETWKPKLHILEIDPV